MEGKWWATHTGPAYLFVCMGLLAVSGADSDLGTVARMTALVPGTLVRRLLPPRGESSRCFILRQALSARWNLHVAAAA